MAMRDVDSEFDTVREAVSTYASQKVVCVTGASGYVASWLVKLLLQRGYTVRATVRDLSNSKKTDHLRALDGATERLHLFKADLLEEGSFDTAIEGCHGVFHTASPCQSTAADPKAELIDPAVNGTLNVLRSCSKYPSIKRIVVTSSINAVTYNGKPLNSDVMVDEAWFSSPKFCEQSQLWYHLSKTLAEEAAWKFSKENGLDMVVINPGIIIGPLLQPTLNTTSAIILNLINGSTTFPNSLVRSVNVKDVAMAHILAYEVPSANGRYCLVESIYHVSEVVEIIRQLYPAFRLPDKCEDDKPFQSTYQVSKEKARTLGMSFIPFQIGITEIIESLKERGFVTLS
ncbi:Phenylacetaldehyde reductase [Rhynchospora pubera]|uniref:Phenylacetaldehyde reductase n=1 Tax=Rhynchospora pubera TaxID=906938 RepID=A0AAV8HRG3_9POAL|nr:Phenylacetaldehyde reductase [Rhynchospora pubera]